MQLLWVVEDFYRDWEMAIRTDAKENGFITPLGEKMIQDNGDGLSYGLTKRCDSSTCT